MQADAKLISITHIKEHSVQHNLELMQDDKKLIYCRKIGEALVNVFKASFPTAESLKICIYVEDKEPMTSLG